MQYKVGFPGGSVVKSLPASAGDADSIPGLGSTPGGENGNPLQCSCLGNPMDRGAWWATVHGVAKELDTTELLKNNVEQGVWEFQILPCDVRWCREGLTKKEASSVSRGQMTWALWRRDGSVQTLPSGLVRSPGRLVASELWAFQVLLSALFLARCWPVPAPLFQATLFLGLRELSVL